MLFFGFGFTAKALAVRLAAAGWKISATSRTEQGLAEIAGHGYRSLRFEGLAGGDLKGITHLTASAPPGEDGDPVVQAYGTLLETRAEQFAWAGYLSTTGVYGDHGGGWVTEATPLTPNTERGRKRVGAEQQWASLHQRHGLPVQLFRLAGIYGPGRNQLESLLAGTAQRIVKPGQIFSRIHVDDIVSVLEASMARPDPGQAYNVCDDYPCPPQEVVGFAAHLLGVPPPPEIPFDEAPLSAMARSFYADSKRVSNARIKGQLGVRLAYPSYREGLTALLQHLRR